MDPSLIQTLYLVLVSAIVLLLPGTALRLLANRFLDAKSNPPVSVVAALPSGVGLSVAFWPLLLLYTTLTGQRFIPAFLWIVLGASALAIVLCIMQGRSKHGPTISRVAIATGLTLLGLVILSLIFRLNDIDGLLVPLFGDSLHHTMITSIITNTGRVPSGYEPYVPVNTFTYHFGFHTLAAVLAQLTGATPVQAVLVMGQVLNIAALLVGYLLARTFFSSYAAGLAAALLTGFVSVMPAYYVNWGRYTQLAGLVLLPVAIVFLVRALDEKARRSDIALAALCVAGLAVVHYRILIFYGLLVIALAAWLVVWRWRERQALVPLALRAAGIGLTGLLVASPWLINVVSKYVPGLVGRLSTVTPEYLAGYNSLENFRAYTGAAMALLGLPGFGLALTVLISSRKSAQPKQGSEEWGPAPARQPAFMAIVVATWMLLMLVSIGVVPGAIGSYTVAISLYIPLSMLGRWVGTRLRVPLWAATAAPVAVALLSALVLGTWHVANTGCCSYVHEPDLQAFKWIASNTPPGARFLISSELSYAGRGVTASDAGMWLPLLANRQVSVPALAAWTENPIVPDFFTQARKLAAYTQPAGDPVIQRLVALGTVPAPHSPSDPEMLALMQAQGITHVYSGTSGGATKLRLDIAAMRRDACHYRLARPPDEGVYIFEVSYSSCK